jgi:outer membrane protein assembly factor BamB
MKKNGLVLIALALLLASCQWLEDLLGGGNEGPVASFVFTPQADYAPAVVDFDATGSSDADGSVVDYHWDFGDSEEGWGDLHSHHYATAGPFTVTLTVTDDEGATGSATDMVIFVGGIMWRFETDAPIYYSSPVVGSDGTIYVGTGIYIHTDSGSLYAVNPDGTQKWMQQLDAYPSQTYPKGDNGYSPAIAADGTIYIQGATSALYAYDPPGNRLWKYVDFDTYPIGFEVGQRTPAVGSDGTLYVAADALYAVYPNGTRKWRVGSEWCRTSPAIGPGGTIYVMSGQDDLMAVNPNGTIQWVFLLDNDWEMSFASPAIDSDGTIYIAAEAYGWGYLYAVTPAGQKKWRHAVVGDGRILRSSPAIGPDGTIYVGTKAGGPTTPGQLLAIDPVTGTLNWAFDISQIHQTPDDTYCSPTVDDDGTIYFGAETGTFYAVNPDGTLKWSVPLEGGNNWSSPALLADGTIYIGSHQTTFQGFWIGQLSAIKTDSPGLAASPWPKFRLNNRNTGRYGDQ